MINQTTYRVTRRNRRAAFTLMEVMLVLVILGILGGMAAIFIAGQQDEAMRRAAKVEIKTIETALTQYRLDMLQYPAGQDGLSSLIQQPSGDQGNRWRGPYLKPDFDQLDPWGNQYEVEYQTITGNKQTILIRSAGPDGAMQTDDDVTSSDPS